VHLPPAAGTASAIPAAEAIAAVRG
jgi:hypothetical protein